MNILLPYAIEPRPMRKRDYVMLVVLAIAVLLAIFPPFRVGISVENQAGEDLYGMYIYYSFGGKMNTISHGGFDTTGNANPIKAGETIGEKLGFNEAPAALPETMECTVRVNMGKTQKTLEYYDAAYAPGGIPVKKGCTTILLLKGNKEDGFYLEFGGFKNIFGIIKK